MSKQEFGPTEERGNVYPGLECLVYDAVDFYPRGSLYSRSHISPPYPISKNPSHLNSVQDVVQEVLRVNPKSDIGAEVSFLSSYSHDNESDNISQRVRPEEVSIILNVNFLRSEFRRFFNGDRDIFSEGDKLAIIMHIGEKRSFLLVDVAHGHYIFVNTSAADPQFLKLNTNEKLPSPKPDEWDLQRQREQKFKEQVSEPFESTDLIGQPIKMAEDEGKRKKYPRETVNFFRRMEIADLTVENILINDMDSVVGVSDSIHRLGRRIGRHNTRELLKKLRLNGIDQDRNIFEVMKSDTEYAHNLDPYYKVLSVDEIKKGFRLMFKAEEAYMGALFDFPWNKVGPEPFDSLIEVFWFRFDFHHLQNNWVHREASLGLPALKNELYRDAQIERILTWAHATQNGLIASHLKDIKELGIEYTMAEVEKVAGPLRKYFNKEKIKERIVDKQSRSRPSELTLLLWKTLKWAHASDWKQSGAMLTSDFKFIDPDLWDEKFPDPEWLKIGDLQGRLILPGETLDKPLSHLKSDRRNKDLSDEIVSNIRTYRKKNEKNPYYQLEKEIAFKMEQQGDEINQKDLLLEKQHESGRPKTPKAYESIALDFNKAILRFSRKQLLSIIDSLPRNERLVVLHRLGYSVSGESTGITFMSYKVGIEANRPISYLVNTLFQRHTNVYYSTLKRATSRLIDSKMSFY